MQEKIILCRETVYQLLSKRFEGCTWCTLYLFSAPVAKTKFASWNGSETRKKDGQANDGVA
jgi:hypothetical protein